MACGTSPAITAASLPAYDYAAFTGQAAANDAAPKPLQLIAREDRITPQALQQRWVDGWGGRASMLSHVCFICQCAATIPAHFAAFFPRCTGCAGYLARKGPFCWTCGQQSSTTSATCQVG